MARSRRCARLSALAVALVAVCGSPALVRANDEIDESTEFDDIDMPEALAPEQAAPQASAAGEPKKNLGFGTVLITFCHGWGYAKLYNEVAAHLKHNNPDLVVEGHYHEADEPKPTIAKAVSSIYGFLLLMIIFGDKLFAMMGVPMPGILVKARESQMWSMFGIYYVGNLIAQNLMNTGAFEISYNGQMVWSKLDSGRLPSWPELVAKMQNADSLAGGEPLHRLVMEQNAM